MRAPRSLVLSLASIALIAGITGCSSSSNHSAMAGVSSAATDSRIADISFAQLMIPHHQQAVEMADMALVSAQDAKVKDLAKAIKGAQDPEIAQMRAWLTSWGAPEQMPGTSSADSMDHSEMDHSGMDMGGMSMTGMMSAEDMQKLAGSTGADFDRMWLEMMIAHHEGAVEMGNQVLTTTADADVRKLAEAIVSGQTAEIAQMRAMLQS